MGFMHIKYAALINLVCIWSFTIWGFMICGGSYMDLWGWIWWKVGLKLLHMDLWGWIRWNVELKLSVFSHKIYMYLSKKLRVQLRGGSGGGGGAPLPPWIPWSLHKTPQHFLVRDKEEKKDNEEEELKDRREEKEEISPLNPTLGSATGTIEYHGSWKKFFLDQFMKKSCTLW